MSSVVGVWHAGRVSIGNCGSTHKGYQSGDYRVANEIGDDCIFIKVILLRNGNAEFSGVWVCVSHH